MSWGLKFQDRDNTEIDAIHLALRLQFTVTNLPSLQSPFQLDIFMVLSQGIWSSDRLKNLYKVR